MKLTKLICLLLAVSCLLILTVKIVRATCNRAREALVGFLEGYCNYYNDSTYEQ